MRKKVMKKSCDGDMDKGKDSKKAEFLARMAKGRKKGKGKGKKKD